MVQYSSLLFARTYPVLFLFSHCSQSSTHITKYSGVYEPVLLYIFRIALLLQLLMAVEGEREGSTFSEIPIPQFLQFPVYLAHAFAACCSLSHYDYDGIPPRWDISGVPNHYPMLFS